MDVILVKSHDVIVVDGRKDLIVVDTSGAATVIERAEQGIPGPVGGPAWAVDKTYLHVQSTASDEWVIPHGLGKYPSVDVIDSAGDVVVGDPRHLDVNNMVIRFSAAFSGRATLN